MELQEKCNRHHFFNSSLLYFAVIAVISSICYCATPVFFDWRNVVELRPPRNQGLCGACWAVASIDAMESKIIIQKGTTYQLSPQWLISCTQGGDGCNGGYIGGALESLSCNTDPSNQDACGHSGAVLEEAFPYAASNVPCGCPENEYAHPYCIESFGLVGGTSTPTDQEIRQAIYDHGPVVCHISVYDDLYSYSSGIYEQISTNYLGLKAVVLVGWGTFDRVNYWIVKNTWGPSWGESGYFRAKLGTADIGQYSYYIDNVNGPDFKCGDPGQKYLQADFNQDCYVDLQDFVVFATKYWLECNDPANPDCEY